MGYHIYLDTERITDKPIIAGSTFKLSQAGRYRAVAVEWSGLTSDQSNDLVIDGPATIYIRSDKPGDFQWTGERWLVDGVEVTKEKALVSEKAIKEIIHRYDGIITLEQYNWGILENHQDLNKDGKAIRCEKYRSGILSMRLYRQPDSEVVSQELFAPDGYITESIQYETIDGKQQEIGHWWFEKGLPVKLIGCEGHTLVSLPGIYTKKGSDWVWAPLPEE